MHLYKRVCPSISRSGGWSLGWSVGWSVTRFFDGGKRVKKKWLTDLRTLNNHKTSTPLTLSPKPVLPPPFPLSPVYHPLAQIQRKTRKQSSDINTTTITTCSATITTTTTIYHTTMAKTMQNNFGSIKIKFSAEGPVSKAYHQTSKTPPLTPSSPPPYSKWFSNSRNHGAPQPLYHQNHHYHHYKHHNPQHYKSWTHHWSHACLGFAWSGMAYCELRRC